MAVAKLKILLEDLEVQGYEYVGVVPVRFSVFNPGKKEGRKKGRHSRQYLIFKN